MAVRQLFELADSTSRSVLTASVEEGKYNRSYLFGPPMAGGTFQSASAFTPTVAGSIAADVLLNVAKSIPVVSQQDIVDTLNAILGSTDVAPGNGRIARTLPMFDPTFTGWPARSVTGFRGVGTPLADVSRSSLDPTLAGPNLQFAQPGQVVNLNTLAQQAGQVIPDTLTYQTYLVDIEFAPRPYPVLSDFSVPLRDWPAPWVNSSGNVVPAPKGGLLFPEWWRNCTVTFAPTNQTVNMQQGQLFFNVVGGAKPDRGDFGAVIKMGLPDSVVTFELFAVPFRWITSPNSYIRRLRNLISQWDFWEAMTPGQFMFPAGSLLYQGFSYREYSSALQAFVPWNSAVKSLPKLCDVKLVFLHTERRATNPPAPPNANFKVHGWNAHPWPGGCDPVTHAPFPGGGLFYYASTSPNGNGTPAWLSAPVPHLCFQDPDGSNAVSVDAALPF